MYVMSLDAGTSSARCIIFDSQSTIAAYAQVVYKAEYALKYPKPGWVEQDPESIWITMQESIKLALDMLIAKHGEMALREIRSVGITNQRETTVVWDRNTGKCVYNAIIWQCRRSSDYCAYLKSQKAASDMITSRTGLVIDAYFSATKIKWILDNVQGAKEKAFNGQLLFGTVDTYLIWKLTQGRVHATDYSNASRTMLFDIHRLCWDKDICNLLDIPISILPSVMPSSGFYGYAQLPYHLCLPITGCAGDQQSALFGQCCFSRGEAKSTYGTGCFILLTTGDSAVYSRHGLLSTIAWFKDGKASYALEGSVFTGGSVIQWLRDELGIISSSGETESIARSVTDTNGCYFVPAFTGIGAPYWAPDARGCICGLTRGTCKAHIVRAALESIAYQVSDILCAMEEDTGSSIALLGVDGGACVNDFLMQFQSDISGTKVCRPRCIETTALGAAYLSGLYSGVWKNTGDIIASKDQGFVFTPSMDKTKRAALLSGWHKELKRVLN